MPPADEVDPSTLGDDSPANTGGDVEMVEGTEATAEGDGNDHSELPFAEEGATPDAKPTFISYLMSPIVNLSIGAPEENASLSAHQALLEQSPYFAEICSNFVDDGTVSATSVFPICCDYEGHELTATFYLPPSAPPDPSPR